MQAGTLLMDRIEKVARQAPPPLGDSVPPWVVVMHTGSAGECEAGSPEVRVRACIKKQKAESWAWV